MFSNNSTDSQMSPSASTIYNMGPPAPRPTRAVLAATDEATTPMTTAAVAAIKAVPTTTITATETEILQQKALKEDSMSLDRDEIASEHEEPSYKRDRAFSMPSDMESSRPAKRDHVEKNLFASTTNAGETDTIKHILEQFNSLQNLALEAFHELERVQHHNQALQDDNKVKESEIIRLRSAEKMKEETIKNLYQVVEQAKMETRQSSSLVVTEATLREELVQITEEKNALALQVMSLKRQTTRTSEQVDQLKAKLTRTTQQKFKLEREQRAAISLARSTDQHATADVDFYKRKIANLTGQIQSLNGALMDKNRMIEGMKQQLERSLSRQALAAIQNQDKATKSRTKSD